MKQVGEWIARVINNIDNEDVIAQVRSEVSELCARFPVYGE
jgi:glycine hydroxymethyltransferase